VRIGWEERSGRAGKSTLNRLELTPVGSPAAERYNKISYSAEALDIPVDARILASPMLPSARGTASAL
jgi:hypothetical protein